MSLVPYGHPGCVDLDRLFSLSETLQREGVRMLVDMGEPIAAIATRAGRGLDVIARLAGDAGKPLSHEKDWQI